MLEKNMRYINYKKGQIIFVENTYPAGVFFLKNGKVKKYKSIDDGKEQIIYICTSGEFWGYSALLSGEPYPDSSSAIVDSVVGFIPKDVFLNTIGSSPALSLRLLENLSHEFGVLINNIVIYSHRTVRERLALALLVLKDKFDEKDQHGVPVDIILTREELASVVGTAVETLVRLLREFKNEGLIATQGRKIRVLDENRLFLVAHMQ